MNTFKTVRNWAIVQTDGFYLLFLATIAAVPAISTDMYLPAIPLLADVWGVQKSVVNLSLVLFFVAYSLFLLVLGSLSDKFGRKPILVVGIIAYIISCILCALSFNVVFFIIVRVLQAFGCAACSAMSMAICRDRYTGFYRQRALAYMSIIISLAPMFAPMLGVAVLKIASWPYIFVVQGCMGLFAAGGIIRYRETAEDLTTLPVHRLFTRYKVLFKNKEYMMATSTMGLLTLPFYGFIAFSPIVYLTIFHTSQPVFSYLFAANAAISMSGYFVCSKLIKRFRDISVISIALIGCCAAGLGMLILGVQSIYFFVPAMAAYSFFCSMSRPLSNSLILEQVNTDIGAASSFLVFYQLSAGAIGMAIATYHWEVPLVTFGLMACITPILVLMLWPFLVKRLARKKA